MSAQIGGQNPIEWDEFIAFLQDKDIETYLEVGAREGIALKYLVENTGIMSATAIDLPNAAWGRPNTGRKLENNLSSLNAKTKMILGDSTDREIIDVARKFGPYDLVFIDGDHSYSGVRSDYENYSPMARIVAFHDVNQQPRSRAYGATEFWNEVKNDTSVVFIAPGSRKGIGVL